MMNGIFDAHCHLQDPRLRTQLTDLLRRAAEAGVRGVNCCGCTESDWPTVAAMAAPANLPQPLNPEPNAVLIVPSFGLHPCHIAGRSPDWLRALENCLTAQPAGIGEIGLDRLTPAHNAAEQEKIFVQQLELAHRLRRPVTLHCRQAWGRLLEILHCNGAPPAGFMAHAWSGSVEVMERLLKLGAYISFAGNITLEHHRRARRALAAVPADRLLLETDAPDMTPAGAPRTLNEPAHLTLTLAAAAALRGVAPADLAVQTLNNSRRLFTHQLQISD